jgi:hypothetical protein
MQCTRQFSLYVKPAVKSFVNVMKTTIELIEGRYCQTFYRLKYRCDYLLLNRGNCHLRSAWVISTQNTELVTDKDALRAMMMLSMPSRIDALLMCKLKSYNLN